MKHSFLFIVFFVLSGNLIFSQTQDGSKEISISGTFGSYSFTEKIEGNPYYNNGTYETPSQGYFILALRPGYFIINNLELEPEFMMTAVERDEPSFSISLNLAFNVDFTGSKIHPFILGGYGVCNSIPLLNTLITRSSNKMDISFFNIGAGTKIFVSESVAVRLEYRYQRFTSERNNYYKITNVMNSHKLMFGFSFFF